VKIKLPLNKKGVSPLGPTPDKNPVREGFVGFAPLDPTLHKNSIRKGLTGFTLIELLIAASISAVIIVSLYAAFQTSLFSYNRLDQSCNVFQEAGVILNRLEMDLKNAFSYCDAQSKFKGTDKSLEFLSITDFFKEGKALSGIASIKYEFSNERLLRRGLFGLEALKESSEVQGEELSLEVKDILFQYATIEDAPETPISWQKSWPPEGSEEQKNKLPLAVKIKLSVIERDRHKKEVGVVEFIRLVSLTLG
jgi:prepilin-type N-terminal cleavage/methylation domain-containing protein